MDGNAQALFYFGGSRQYSERLAKSHLGLAFSDPSVAAFFKPYLDRWNLALNFATTKKEGVQRAEEFLGISVKDLLDTSSGEVAFCLEGIDTQTADSIPRLLLSLSSHNPDASYRTLWETTQKSLEGISFIATPLTAGKSDFVNLSLMQHPNLSLNAACPENRFLFTTSQELMEKTLSRQETPAVALTLAEKPLLQRELARQKAPDFLLYVAPKSLYANHVKATNERYLMKEETRRGLEATALNETEGVTLSATLEEKEIAVRLTFDLPRAKRTGLAAAFDHPAITPKLLSLLPENALVYGGVPLDLMTLMKHLQEAQQTTEPEKANATTKGLFAFNDRLKAVLDEASLDAMQAAFGPSAVFSLDYQKPPLPTLLLVAETTNNDLLIKFLDAATQKIVQGKSKKFQETQGKMREVETRLWLFDDPPCSLYFAFPKGYLVIATSKAGLERTLDRIAVLPEAGSQATVRDAGLSKVLSTLSAAPHTFLYCDAARVHPILQELLIPRLMHYFQENAGAFGVEVRPLLFPPAEAIAKQMTPSIEAMIATEDTLSFEARLGGDSLLETGLLAGFFQTLLKLSPGVPAQEETPILHLPTP